MIIQANSALKKMYRKAKNSRQKIGLKYTKFASDISKEKCLTLK